MTNDSLRVVVGVTEGLSQDAGSGTAGDAYGIYALPASAGDVAVEALSPDGTVTLKYNGSRIVLAPGERWETISTEVACTPNYSIRYTPVGHYKKSGIPGQNRCQLNWQCKKRKMPCTDSVKRSLLVAREGPRGASCALCNPLSDVAIILFHRYLTGPVPWKSISREGGNIRLRPSR